MRDADVDTRMAATAAFPGELMVWLSASFPVGGFAYSQGLETAVEKRWVTDRATLASWLNGTLEHGSLRNDLIFINLIRRADDHARIDALVDLAVAMQPSAERHGEAVLQGRSFVQAYEAAWQAGSCPFAERPGTITLPAALAVAARQHDIPAPATLEAYAIAFLNNLISAAIRLGVVGQFDGQRVMADLLGPVRSICAGALRATEDDLGAATWGADLASLLHETQTTRLFRS